MLILALVFLVAVSLVVTALLSWLGTSLNATASFTYERNVEYGVTDAVNLAIQNTRYSFDVGTPTPFLNNATPELCATYAVPEQSNSVHVYCSMIWQPFSANTRVFSYSACTSDSPSDATPADCAAMPLLQAVVAFDDYPSGVATPSPQPSPCTPIQSNGTCGLSMSQVSWQWHPIVPAITSFTPASPSGPVTGGTTLTINGSGFTSGATVNFVLQNPTSGTYNPLVPASIIPNPAPGCALPTCLQVTSPVITTGSSYFVMITTPGGTSQITSNDYSHFVPTFTYNPVTPTVLGLVGTASGSVSGNTPVIIQGTGFWSTPNNQYPVRVLFCPTAGGTCLPGIVVNVSPPAPGSSVETMNALTPASTTQATYYVQVESFNLDSTQTNVVFNYQVEVPLITSLSPASTPLNNGDTLIINGANFLSGTTVGFCAETNGNLNNGSCPSGLGQIAVPTNDIVNIQSTSITLTVPSMTSGTYYPIVTVPGQSNPSQPYNLPADIFTHA